MKTINSVKKLSRYNLGLFLLINAAALGAVMRSRDDPYTEFHIFTFLGIIYLSWAFLHHYFDKSLTLEIMIEYVLTVALALVILYSLLI